MICGGYSIEAEEKPLRGYQTYAAEWMLERLYVRGWEGCGLFLDPGLGKTRTTLAVLNALFDLDEIRRALVVAPLRPIYTVWGAEIDRWGFPMTNVILHNQHARAMAMGCRVELINFEGVEKIAPVGKRWDMVVIDESTFVKNWSANRTKAMKRLIRQVPRRTILTGTPAANSLCDLHAQHYMIDRGRALGATVGAFRERFCRQGGFQSRQWLIRKGVEDTILDAVKDTCLRMQAEDHLDMPQLVENEIWCKMPDRAYRQYTRLKRELFAELETGSVLVDTAGGAYHKCRQMANGQVYEVHDDGSRDVHNAHAAKLQALFELHEELSGKPMLVFYEFESDRDRILQTKNSPFRGSPVICGGMEISEVESILDRWNNGQYHALLGQWKAVSHGLNMQGACNDVVCYGLIDSLETYDQAFRRVYRQGVKGDQVRIHRILTAGTVDEAMLERQRGKIQTQDEFLQALKKHARS